MADFPQTSIYFSVILRFIKYTKLREWHEEFVISYLEDILSTLPETILVRVEALLIICNLPKSAAKAAFDLTVDIEKKALEASKQQNVPPPDPLGKKNPKELAREIMLVKNQGRIPRDLKECCWYNTLPLPNTAELANYSEAFEKKITSILEKYDFSDFMGQLTPLVPSVVTPLPLVPSVDTSDGALTEEKTSTSSEKEATRKSPSLVLVHKCSVETCYKLSSFVFTKESKAKFFFCDQHHQKGLSILESLIDHGYDFSDFDLILPESLREDDIIFNSFTESGELRKVISSEFMEDTFYSVRVAGLGINMCFNSYDLIARLGIDA